MYGQRVVQVAQLEERGEEGAVGGERVDADGRAGGVEVVAEDGVGVDGGFVRGGEGR